MFLLRTLLVLTVSAPLHQGARILGMFPMWARSHHRFLQPVVKILAEAGHEVVVYSPFPLSNPPPNYTDVHLKNIKTESEELTQWFFRITQMPHWKCFDAGWDIHETMYREFIGDPKIKQLLSSNEHFDIIITEGFSAQEYALLLGHIFKVPVIAVQAFLTNNVINSQLGNSLSLSFSPGTCSSYSSNMSLFERLMNAFASLRDLFYYYNYQLANLEKIMREDFPDMPPLLELTQNVSLMFVNDHLTADYAQPRPPNIIPVAGIHIEPPKALPKDINDFMNRATQGVIFFSLGTYVQDELQPKEYFDMYNNVFRKLKQRVLWKTRKENIEGLPSNVMTVKWAPQQDLLAHHNCVLFITHGGLQSQHEAIHFGVPVVVIPHWFDQHRNARFYEEQGVGVKIEMEDLSEISMLAAVQEVLDVPSYKDNMKRLSQIFRDRPLSPAESVVFWTEYVLRHGGAGHLRPASTGLRWYQRALLDVLAVVLAVFISIIFISYLIITKVTRLFYGTRNDSKHPTKKYE